MNGRLATLVAITGVLLAASGCGKQSGGTGSLGDAPSTPAATNPAGDPATPAPEPSVVQAKWFLVAEDLGNGGSAEILPSERVTEARINPCGGRLPSDDQRLARAAAHVLYRYNEIPDSTPDGTAYEVITLYRSGGAEAFLADLRAAVQRCPTATQGDMAIEREIAKTDFVGDQSILIRETAKYDFEGTPRQSISQIAAIRLGQRILLLDVSGWEGTDVTQTELDRLIDAAIKRAAL
jgi:hypothetical protein